MARHGPKLMTGDHRRKFTTRRKDDSNDDRQTTTLPGHGDPVPRIPLPAAQNARGRPGAAAAHECRGAGGMHFARLHVAAGQGAAEASQSGSDGPNDRARQSIEWRVNRPVLIAEKSWESICFRTYANASSHNDNPAPLEPRPSPRPNDHREVTMKTQVRIASLSLLTILCLGLAAAPARAGILYDNGPINGAVNRQDIKHGSGNAVSDSFFLTAGMSNLESVHFGMWTEVEARPSTVEWEIGSTPFAADKGFGTATLTWNYVGYSGGCCDITEASFTFPSINLGPGQYWLTLSNAVACGPFGCNGVVGWDENRGAGCGGCLLYTSPSPRDGLLSR